MQFLSLVAPQPLMENLSNENIDHRCNACFPLIGLLLCNHLIVYFKYLFEYFLRIASSIHGQRRIETDVDKK
ncbi:hypothetical protein T03_17226 [Trichinella britovi]|uniref:Uncharacterized protein n=1 Tax=Trichinella britovi TaxID=45882 RepID=A0A0V1D9K7_TRIBR|nr:hypothetical protein T03_17226 [Trichinella britovi]